MLFFRKFKMIRTPYARTSDPLVKVN